MNSFEREGQIVDLIQRRIFPGKVVVKEGKIHKIIEDHSVKEKSYLLPGFVDAHVHIESSMLLPSEFARLATIHGTVATVSDPHEIGNVLGVAGVRYMIENGKRVPFHFAFGAPSCVPATTFETNGATISAKEIETLFKEDQLLYLSEMMNYPGVLHQDPEVMKKIAIAKQYKKPIDGHAPGLIGEEAERYAAAGISTDHECFTLEEGRGKAKIGMQILIREGSAAKNYAALHPLIGEFPEKVMFSSDDKHPHELVKGHINELVKRSVVTHGYDLFDVLRAASYNPIRHYKLKVGLLQEGDSADFIAVNNLEEFDVKETFIQGNLVAKEGKALLPHLSEETPNHFHAKRKTAEQFHAQKSKGKTPIIIAEEGQLITKRIDVESPLPDMKRDFLKLTVVSRYTNEEPAVAFVHGFGLKRGAIASTVAHDSHNLIAVGCSDEEIARAINLLIESKGGISVVNGKREEVMALPVAGLISPDDGFLVAKRYEELDERAKALGSTLSAPFMTLSFMALLVIPELKLSDKGLFDGKSFKLLG